MDKIEEKEFNCIDDVLRYRNEKGEGDGCETLEDVLNFDNHFKPKSKENNGINFCRFTAALAYMTHLQFLLECDKYDSQWWENKRKELKTLYDLHTDYE